MTEKLHDIVEDAKASLVEYAIKAAIAGYADGVKLGHDDTLNGRDAWCDGWIAGWNANAHRLKVCHVEKDYDSAMFTCSVCANDLYDMDRYCSKCGSKIVEYGDE